MKAYQTDILFKETVDQLTSIKHPPFDEKEAYFNADFPASKALRIILLKFYLNILYYRDRLLETHEDEDLHQFRVNIRKSRAFIKTFGFLFERELDVLLLTQLSKIASFTNKKRDLDVIKKELTTILEKKSKLHQEIDTDLSSEKKRINLMLQSQNLQEFLDSYYTILIEGEHLFVPHTKDAKIKKSAKKVIQKLQHTIQKRIKSLKKHFSVEKLHKIRISFKKLRYLLEEFQHLFKKKDISKSILQMKELQTILGDLNDTVNQKRLIMEHVDTHTSDASYDKVIHLTSKKEKKLIEDALDALGNYEATPLHFV